MKRLLRDVGFGVIIFGAIVIIVLFAASKSGNFIYAAF